jgi:monofunctional biosynthetic peptidoglycan transglycosylase
VRVLLARGLIAAAVVILCVPTVVIVAYREVDPPLTPLMVLRRIEGAPIERRWQPLEDISPHLAHAVIAAEDNLFCRHHGFDTEALRAQLAAWWRGERPRGASTITMQTAKNVLLWPGRDLARKAIEAWLTPQIETLWSKRRILEVYLNVAEMGRGIYGAEAAARAHFGKPARSLTAWESALIAASLPSPRASSLSRPDAPLVRKARRIAARVSQLGPLLDCAAPERDLARAAATGAGKAARG